MVASVLRWTLTPDASPDGLEQAVRSAIAEAPAEVADAVNNVLKRTKDDNKVVTMKVGPACELKSGVPAAIHNLLGASDFVDAARRNIFACGDTCGRAMVVGSIAGALYAGSANALPVAWIERLTHATEVKKLVQSVTE
jgi:ADP-ribosylglycohydrolase